MKLIYCIFILLHITYASVSHDNVQIWRVYFTSEFEDTIQKLIGQFYLDVWSTRSNSVDILIKPEIAPIMEAVLLEDEMTYDILIEDIQRIINTQEISRRDGKYAEPVSSFVLDRYHDLDEIYTYLDELSDEFNYVTVETIGHSVEGREIKAVRLSTQANNPTAMWVHCGAHAREWVSPASCLFGLNYFTNNYGLDNNVTTFLDSQDLYMVVVVNPDGYSYSWTDDRLWRKNRRVNEGSICSGVDLNRNYDDGTSWGESGASGQPCAETFHGTNGFSEPELVAIRDKVISIQETQTIKSFYDVHSYSNLWLYAFAYLPDESEFVNDLDRTASAGSSAMTALYGTKIEYGPHYSAIYPASGTSLDWAYSRGIIHSYILELRDNGEFGFVLPEDQIVPTATELWTGIFAADAEM